MFYLLLQCSVILCSSLSPFHPLLHSPPSSHFCFPFLPLYFSFLPFSLSWERVLNATFPSAAHFVSVCVCVCFLFLHLSFSFSFLFPFLSNQETVGADFRDICPPADASFSLEAVRCCLWNLCKWLSFTWVATDLLPNCYLSWSCSAAVHAGICLCA